MSKTLFVGIELSKESNLAQFMDESGSLLRKYLSFPNDLDGIQTLCQAILRILENDLGISSLKIGMESTGLYWWHLREYLALNPILPGLDQEIYIINPALVKGFKKAYTKLPKTDDVDAWVIADRLRFGRLHPSSDTDIRYEPLRRLSRFHYTMAQAIRVDKNRILDLVFLKFSNYKEASKGRTFTNASLAVLDEFTVNEIVEKPVEELLKFLLSNTNSRFHEPDLFVQELKTAAKRSYPLKCQDARLGRCRHVTHPGKHQIP